MQHGLAFQHPATVGERVCRQAGEVFAGLRDHFVVQPLGSRGAQQHRVDLHRRISREGRLRPQRYGDAFAFQPAG